jgi:hypothetical protein
MALKMSAGVRNKAAEFASLFNGGTMKIFSGSRPSDTNGAETAVLATITLQNPAFTLANGVATIADPAAVSASATGTATWFRLIGTTTTNRVDGSITTVGGGGDLELNTTSLVSGLAVDITGGTITMAGA